MRFSRNEDLAGWQAVVAPGDGTEPGAGPAGPAGTSLLQVGNASLSLCTMTGRVTHAWIPDAPDGAGRALYELAFGRALDVGRLGATAFDDTVLPLTDRAALVRWAHLRDVVRYVDLRPDPVARVLARLEYTAALTDVHVLAPAGGQLVPVDELADDLAASDIVIARFRAGGGAVDQVAGKVGQFGVGGAVAPSLRDVRASLTAARELTDVLSPGTDRFIDDVIGELGMSFRSTATAQRADADRLLAEVRPPQPVQAVGRWGSHGAADTASRAGWAALQQGRAGVAAMNTAAQLIFAEAAVAWWQLGSQFKGGWAWTLADEDEARAQLDAAGARSAEPALAGVAESPDLPAVAELLAPPLWMLVASVNHLLPRPDPVTSG